MSIKFRAWDKIDNLMLYPDKIILGKENYILNSSEERCYVPSEAILLQFTGLFDKNGKEIYEGDIAKITHTGRAKDGSLGKYTELGVMEFNVNGAFYGFKCEDSLFNKDFWGMTVEIIGNVFENPDLRELTKNAEEK